MKIDTVHEAHRSVVHIEVTTERERELTDDEWKQVANNQHKLQWINGSGCALLPAALRGRMPAAGVTVKRDGDRIFVVFPLEES